MKKIKAKLQPKAFLKFLSAAILLGLYWYWINQKLISDTNQAFGLTGFFLLMSAATAFFPLPANILVLGAVKNYDALLVAMVGGFATLVAYLAEYIVFTLLFRFNKIANFKNSWLYQKVAPLFDKNKFFILSFASFLPIPSEALRIYAITRKYSKIGYMLSGFVGRIPRYFLLGYYGRAYVNSVWFLIAVFVFPAFFLLAIRGTVGLVNMVRLRVSANPDQSAVSIPVPISSPSNLEKPDVD